MTPQDREAGLARAHERVGHYRGLKNASHTVVAFTREAVRDALTGSSQPTTDAWVRYTTSVVGRLAASCEAQGVPLTREAVFDRARIDRFLTLDCSALTPMSRACYRSRLDSLAETLLNGATGAPWPRASISAYDVTTPYTYAETGRMTAWARAVRPYPRRERVQAVIALGLGAGLRSQDMPALTGEMVTRDETGVHVHVPGDPGSPGNRQPRTVTVVGVWENAVWEHAQAAGPNLVIARSRSRVEVSNVNLVLRNANQTAPVRVVPRRLRNTWLARHLIAGTPLPVLLPQAGVTTLSFIEDLLLVPDLLTIADPGFTAERAASWMRSMQG